MRKILFFAILLLIMASCDKKDDIVFDVDVPNENFKFETKAGKAVLNYVLPKDSEIYAIRANYKDFKGKTRQVEGTYQNTSMVLEGFIYETKDIDVDISFLDRNNNISKSKKLKFSVNNSVPKVVMDNVKISTSWSGFQVQYECDLEPTGFIHIGKMGVNKFGNLDTLLIDTKAIAKGSNLLNYKDQANDENYTDVVIWAEDFSGNILPDIKSQKVIGSQVELLKHAVNGEINWNFYGSSNEDEDYRCGVQYLYDGKKKGEQKLEPNAPDAAYFMYFTEPRALPLFGDNSLKIVFNEPKTLAKVRWYWPVNYTGFYYDWYYSHTGNGMDWCYYAPNSYKIYVRESENSERVLIESKDYDKYEWFDKRYTWHFAKYNRDAVADDLDEFNEMEAPYYDISFPYTNTKYKIIEMEINDVYWDNGPVFNGNDNKQFFGLSELEVYVKKENKDE